MLLVNTALLDCIMSVSPCWVWNIIFRGKNSLLDDTLEKEKGINKGCSTGWQIASFSFNRYYLKGRDLIFSLLLSTIKLVLLKADSLLLGCKTWQTLSEWLWGIPVQIHYDIKGHLISLWLTCLSLRLLQGNKSFSQAPSLFRTRRETLLITSYVLRI